MDVVLSRTSVRRFVDRPVEHEKVGKILEIARYSPSAGNVQNWVFLVVESLEQRERIAVACLKQKWIASAPILIVVCDETEKITKMYEKRAELYRVQNCAMAAYSLLLAATSVGLGSCLVSAFDEEAVKDILKLPESVIPEAVIPIGYPFEPAVGKPQRHTLDHLTRFEDWTNKRRHLFMPLLEKQDLFIREKQKQLEHVFKSLKEKIKRLRK